MFRYFMNIIFAFLFSCLLVAPVLAQQADARSKEMFEVPVGSVIEPRGDGISAWNQPPSGFLNSLGDKVGKFDGKKEYVVEDRKEVPSIFGRQYWFKVRPADGVGDCGRAGCWAYQGELGGNTNFSPK
ncbi:hypothetical protein [Breoghania sp.]|uniref:hypothetical protein n=1 Tax=Breoghania sp. TaxID=2065378 RepID=UPI0029CA8C30|nr:hypothetical protein [Breoghania sp.]